MHRDAVPYKTALRWQRNIYNLRVQAVKNNRPVPRDTLLLLQHPPVYTLGARSDVKNILTNKGRNIGVEKTERGGEVTYHGPGQLVLYPILNLRSYRCDAHWYVRSLEEVVIRTLAHFDVQGHRKIGLPGVWVGDAKVCAIGTKISRWITMHGLSLNVHPNLCHFAGIIPCGLEGRPVTSIRNILGEKHSVSMSDVRHQILGDFSDVFGVEIHVSPGTPKN